MQGQRPRRRSFPWSARRRRGHLMESQRGHAARHTGGGHSGDHIYPHIITVQQQNKLRLHCSAPAAPARRGSSWHINCHVLALSSHTAPPHARTTHTVPFSLRSASKISEQRAMTTSEKALNISGRLRVTVAKPSESTLHRTIVLGSSDGAAVERGRRQGWVATRAHMRRRGSIT